MKRIFILLITLFPAFMAHSQNPIITDQYTADPSARVFNGRVYVYPSHDIPCGKGQGIIGFCMADYHVFSSDNLTDWQDHGVIVSQEKIPWVDPKAYTMWAPDCIFKNGKYYFYFPATDKNKTLGRGFRVGVAIADSPAGPFVPQETAMEGVFGIDPEPFIDADGQGYIYWAGGGGLFVAKLTDDMLGIASEPQKIEGLPEGFKEGPYLFERNGIYYMTFPYVPKTTEQLVYATGKSPLGPFEFKGVIMEESPVKCWTNHHSFIDFKGQWYLFYHHNDFSPAFDKNRSIRVDSLFFEADGSIRKVNPTFRGVGITPATNKIQVDRYSAVSGPEVKLEFVDTLNRFEGWKAVFTQDGSWLRYNAVEFPKEKLKKLTLRVYAPEETKLEIRLGSVTGELIGVADMKSSEFADITVKVKKYLPGRQDLFLVSKGNAPVEVDWVRFE
jgi:hypothetical protein